MQFPCRTPINMSDMNQNIQPTDTRDVMQRLTQAFGKLPQVLAVVLGGSRAAATSDVASDYDLYVYTVREVPVDFRRTLLGESAEIDNRFWEPGDEWSDPSTGTHCEVGMAAGTRKLAQSEDPSMLARLRGPNGLEMSRPASPG